MVVLVCLVNRSLFFELCLNRNHGGLLCPVLCATVGQVRTGSPLTPRHVNSDLPYLPCTMSILLCVSLPVAAPVIFLCMCI